MTKKCKRCGKRTSAKDYCKKCKDWIKRQNWKELKKHMKESKKMKITLRMEKDGRYVEKRISHDILHALFDLQYMMHESDWDTLKLNKMDKEIEEFFRIVEYMSDAVGDGKTYKWDDKQGWSESGHKYYLGGGRPKWKKLKKGIKKV